MSKERDFKVGWKEDPVCQDNLLVFNYFFFANRILSSSTLVRCWCGVAVYVMKSSMYRVPMFWRFFSAMARSASALFGKLTTASPDGRPSLLRWIWMQSGVNCKRKATKLIFQLNTKSTRACRVHILFLKTNLLIKRVGSIKHNDWWKSRQWNKSPRPETNWTKLHSNNCYYTLMEWATGTKQFVSYEVKIHVNCAC